MARNLPPEPKREDYKTDDEHQAALVFWRHRVGPLLGTRKAAPARSKKRGT